MMKFQSWSVAAGDGDRLGLRGNGDKKWYRNGRQEVWDHNIPDPEA